MDARSEKDPLNTVGGVDYINYSEKHDERRDRRTGGQTRANLNAPYRHGGIKIPDRKLPEALAKSRGVETTILQG